MIFFPEKSLTIRSSADWTLFAPSSNFTSFVRALSQASTKLSKLPRSLPVRAMGVRSIPSASQSGQFGRRGRARGPIRIASGIGARWRGHWQRRLATLHFFYLLALLSDRVVVRLDRLTN